VTDSKGHFHSRLNCPWRRTGCALNPSPQIFPAPVRRKFPEEYYTSCGRARRSRLAEALPCRVEGRNREALQLELGNQESEPVLLARIKRSPALRDKTILIGGPPCQAYSLVAAPETVGSQAMCQRTTQAHSLRELHQDPHTTASAAFVMENVKGMLSSSLHESRIFGLVLKDLRSAGEDTNLWRSLPAILPNLT